MLLLVRLHLMLISCPFVDNYIPDRQTLIFSTGCAFLSLIILAGFPGRLIALSSMHMEKASAFLGTINPPTDIRRNIPAKALYGHFN